MKCANKQCDSDADKDSNYCSAHRPSSEWQQRKWVEKQDKSDDSVTRFD